MPLARVAYISTHNWAKKFVCLCVCLFVCLCVCVFVRFDTSKSKGISFSFICDDMWWNFRLPAKKIRLCQGDYCSIEYCYPHFFIDQMLCLCLLVCLSVCLSVITFEKIDFFLFSCVCVKASGTISGCASLSMELVFFNWMIIDVCSWCSRLCDVLERQF